ncbi:MAG TPA: 50S ribosomal protein L11 methyltransferase, partial [Pyrinomonadaceae bacterium]|nr:50S ribosomal protein L11 methyltransferase [Pyrinomonadaceae bacterium]
MNWFAFDVTLEPAAREAVEYALMEAGALGTETKDSADELLTSGYFEREPERESVRAALFEALRIYGLASSAVRAMQVREVAARDWLAEWKESWRPVEVGARFLVAPPWSEIEHASERIVIRIEPGMAFGTGTHETTRLCLAAIERHFDGASFL